MIKLITLFCVVAAMIAFLVLVMNARSGVTPSDATNPGEPVRFGSPL